ncbi:uncharacterized protein LOC126798891 [Argentina anserina]|uniref:uncharacterized protein LOC126798891 n=1 Tax=Argentina anserina TaxID=57926 RepID=UPI0021763BEA|nr:uncharacterized protein LOC126798891 [Potentilla anserina]
MDDHDSTPPRLLGPLGKLRRRNSISTSKLSHLSSSSSASSSSTSTAPNSPIKPRHSCSFPTQNATAAATPRHRPPQLDLELLSPKSSDSYTSLKDLLPSSSLTAVQSPTPNSTAATSSGYEISIRNRLVQQAAWAYLQPMSSTSGPSGPHLLHRLWLNCLSFLSRLLPCFHLS